MMQTVRRLVAVIMVALVVTGATYTSTQTVLTTTKPILAVYLSTTPTGWVPVAYGDAQVSVPATFSVIYRGQYPCNPFSNVGASFRGPMGSPDSCVTSVSGAAKTTVVYLRQQRFPSESLSGLQPITRNGRSEERRV